MARNGSGVYSKINTFVAGTVITASDHNENWDDLVSEMTNSVAADGQTTMTGALKLSSGTVALPAWTFSGDLDTGAYRIGANNIGVACSGTKILDISTTGLGITGDMNATTVKQGGFALMPVGSVIDYAGATAPDGWLLCYGQAVSRTTYAALFTAISTTYGAGDGSTTFNLPDARGRATYGKDNMGGSAAGRLTGAVTIDGTSLGNTGGAESHTLTTAQLATHAHAVTGTSATETQDHTHAVSGTTGTESQDHAHTYTAPSGSRSDLATGGAATAVTGTAPATTSGVTATHTHTFSDTSDGVSALHNHAINFTSGNAGSGNAHPQLPPAIVFNKIIYAGV